MTADTGEDSQPILATERDSLLQPLLHKRLALFVSGDAASMALMQLVAEWEAGLAPFEAVPPVLFAHVKPILQRRKAAPENSQLPTPIWLTKAMLSSDAPPPRVVVLAIENGQRPQSRMDAAFVAREADRIGLPHQILTWRMSPPDAGQQDVTRDAGYRLLANVIEAEQLKLPGQLVGRCLVTADTLEDQAASVLAGLAASSGVEGLRGMNFETSLPVGPMHDTRFVTLVRPFLSVAKARLSATLRARDAAWIEDEDDDSSTSAHARFKRGIAMLEGVGISAKSIALSASRLRDAAQSLERHSHSVINGARIRSHAGLYARFDMSNFVKDRHYGILVLRKLFKAYGGDSPLPSLLEFERLFEVMTAVKSWHAFKHQTLGGCVVERPTDPENGPMIYRDIDAVSKTPTGLVRGSSVRWDGGRFLIVAEQDAPAEALICCLGSEGWSDLRKAVPELIRLGLPEAAMVTQPSLRVAGKLAHAPSLHSYLRMIKERDTLAAFESWCGGLANRYSTVFPAM